VSHPAAQGNKDQTFQRIIRMANTDAQREIRREMAGKGAWMCFFKLSNYQPYLVDVNRT